MANNLNTNPKYVDTAAIVSSGPLYVKKLWYHSNADVDDVVIKDVKGNVLWAATVGNISTQGKDVEVNLDMTFDSFEVETIDGGFLLIYS